MTERSAKRIYNEALRNMAIDGIKRVSYGIIK